MARKGVWLLPEIWVASVLSAGALATGAAAAQPGDGRVDDAAYAELAKPPPTATQRPLIWSNQAIPANGVQQTYQTYQRDHTRQTALMHRPNQNKPAYQANSEAVSPSFHFKDVNNFWRINESLHSSQNFYVREYAAIDTARGVTAELAGTILNDGGFRTGLIKLGEGTLALSGENLYHGNTILLQGQLSIGASNALGNLHSAMLEANHGTALHYASGVTVAHPIQLAPIDMQRWLPPGSWTPGAPHPYSDGVRIIVDQGQASQMGDLTGNLPLHKLGAGAWRLAGMSSYMGVLNVHEGSVVADGLFWGAVNVGKGARLAGSGQVGPTTIEAGGVLAPGAGAAEPGQKNTRQGGPAPIGVLRVQGDLRLQPGSRLEVRARADGDADSIQVMHGKAFLGGNVHVLPLAGDWQPSTQYTLVKADGGLDQTRFDGVTVDRDFAFLSPTLGYDEQTAFLTLTRNALPVEELADTPNEQEVAREIDASSPSVGQAVLIMDAPSAKAALQQLAGDWSASIRSSMLDDSRFVRQAVFDWASAAVHADRVVTLDAETAAATTAKAPAATETTASRAAVATADAAGGAQAMASDWAGAPRPVWGRTFYSAADRSGRGGIRADQRDIAGFVLGLHRKFRRDGAASVFAGLQSSRLRQPSLGAQGATADIQSVHLGAALSGLWKMARLTAGMAHTWHALSSARTIELNRQGQVLTGDYDAGQTQVFGEIAAPRSAGGSVKIEPFFRLAALTSRVRGFAERGGDAALTVRASRDHIGVAVAGVKVERTIPGPHGDARILASLAWRHTAGAIAPVARQSFASNPSGGVFRADGMPLARNALQFEAGLDAPLGRHAGLQLGYAGQYGARWQDHGLRLGLRVGF